LAARAKGIDIRTVGSGNIGATNAFRVLGKPAGILVLLFDAAKGFAACFLGAFIGSLFVNRLNGLHPTSDEPQMMSALNSLPHFPILAGICAVLGHNYTCWLKFKGGKGIATTAGVYFALAPLAVGIALGTWIVLAVLTRYVSIASIAAAIALPTAVWFTHQGDVLLGSVTTALGLLAIFKHKKNIQRLMAGTENRIGGKKNPAAEGAK
jgi:glycerol-3-phosphate acyltransferase PlsY